MTNDVTRAGCSYFGVRIPRHVRRDMADLTSRGYRGVLHTFSENDFAYYRDTMAEIVAISHAAGLSVLASEHGTVARSLASKHVDRFSGVDWTSADSGAVFVHGATLWLDCSVYTAVEAGDHDIVLLAIEALAMYPDVAPMVFHRSRFRDLTPMAA